MFLISERLKFSSRLRMLRCIAGSVELLFAILTVLHLAVAAGEAVGVAVAVVGGVVFAVSSNSIKLILSLSPP